MIDISDKKMSLVGAGTCQPVTSDIIIINDILVRSNERTGIGNEGETIYIYDAERYNIIVDQHGLDDYILEISTKTGIDISEFDHLKSYVPLKDAAMPLNMSYVMFLLWENGGAAYINVGGSNVILDENFIIPSDINALLVDNLKATTEQVDAVLDQIKSREFDSAFPMIHIGGDNAAPSEIPINDKWCITFNGNLK
jgi:hypothetical protein